MYVKEKPRIAIVGDSFIFSHTDFEDSISQQLQDLNENAEILSFALGSYDLRDYYNWITKEVHLYSPDIVILSLYIGNDIRDLEADRGLTIYEGYLIKKGSIKTIKDKFKFRLVLFLKKYVKSHSFFYKFYAKLKNSDNSGSIAEKYVKAYSNHPETIDNLDQTVEKIKQINDFLDEKDIELVVIMIPQKVQFFSQVEFDKEFYTKIPESHELQDVQREILFPQRYLFENLESAGIEILDLYPFLQSQHKDYYYNFDTHLNTEGNTIVAKEIQKYINNAHPVFEMKENVKE
ncbi:hypothetical protein KY336_04085 [Candidatus Woesearchaeota archaeon]|nr:hypothetical protein [Candidatus Woesearchaeota archaeon]